MGGIGSIQYTGISNRGCARLGGAVAPSLGLVKEKVAILAVLVRRHCYAIGAALRRAVDDEVPSAVEKKTGPAAVRRMPPGPLEPVFFSPSERRRFFFAQFLFILFI